MNTCLRCGRRGKLIDNVCEECFLKTKNLLALKKNKFVACPKCGKWLYRKNLVDLEKLIKNNLITIGEIKDLRINLLGKTLKISAKLKLDHKEIEIEKKVALKINKRLCKDCLKQSGEYYETIVQLRGNWKNVFENMDKTKLSKIKVSKEGLDLYFINRHDAYRFIKKLKLRIKKSYTLHGKKDGKRIYKQTVLVRI